MAKEAVCRVVSTVKLPFNAAAMDSKHRYFYSFMLAIC